MNGDIPKKTRRGITAPSETGTRTDGRYPEEKFPVSIPVLDNVADTLPLNLPLYGKKIIVYLSSVLFGIFALFIIAVVVATVTGFSGLVLIIFAIEIILVAAAINYSIKNSSE